jgi:Cu(I)-responsive transcriptional regulator
MKIGELAAGAGSSPETIRYYERIGMLPAPARTQGNYRDYGAGHVARLSFIRHARALGFELAAIRALLDLADQPDQDCAAVDRITLGHLDVVEAKIAQLHALRSELMRMLDQCRGGQVADCRIIESLSDHAGCRAGHAPAIGSPENAAA